MIPFQEVQANIYTQKIKHKPSIIHLQMLILRYNLIQYNLRETTQNTSMKMGLKKIKCLMIFKKLANKTIHFILQLIFLLKSI